ncbi:hypothetical protein [Acinetobacter haemolyticus]|uniref:hypothetical protein n=1 Tax=Acinetobacter haemolyticus TaxID=29430 RepID=UPI000D68EC07|nr:hypothetical protein [Acinetobacter haemolyticus]
MLASNVLKLRLDRIEQQGHHLSAKDQIKLVTLMQPELTANLYTQLFNLTLPKVWHFRHNTVDEIDCSLRLIQLINRVFIPAYPHHAHRYAWFEQGLNFRLQHTQPPLELSELTTILTQLVTCKDSDLKLNILNQLQEKYNHVSVTLPLAELYARLEDWSAAIKNYRRVFQQQDIQPESVHYDFIRCLMSRNDYRNEQGLSDAVEALEHLSNLDYVQQPHLHEQLTQKAVALLLPENLQSQHREIPKPLIDIQQKLKFVGYSLNHWLTTDEFIVPYYKNVVECAPKLLNNHEIVVSLDRHKAANTALQKILTGRDLKLVNGINTANHGMGFIWNYLQINPLVLDALVTASHREPDAFYNLKQIPAPDYHHDAALLQVSSYLAKQQVAYNLSQQGHCIEFVEHTDVASFDLIVDGTPMQVKCSLDADRIEAFAKHHPHIAIIVNIELAHLQEKYPSVFADFALSYASVQRSAVASLQHSAGNEEFLPIPLMNTGFAVYRNFNKAGQPSILRMYSQDKYSSSISKNGLAVGAAIGGVISGSIGAFLVGGFAIYRTWRIQKTEQRRPVPEKVALKAQSDLVIDLLIRFAEWFNQNLLKYRVDLYAFQLRQIETKLMGKIPETVISTTLYAYKFESYQRALRLHQWIQKQLAYDHPKRRAQAGWVALAQADQFMSIELKKRMLQLNTELQKYKQMSQHVVKLPDLEQQVPNAANEPYSMQAI